MKIAYIAYCNGEFIAITDGVDLADIFGADNFNILGTVPGFERQIYTGDNAVCLDVRGLNGNELAELSNITPSQMKIHYSGE